MPRMRVGSQTRVTFTFALVGALIAALLLTQSTLAAVSQRYQFTGLEVWFTSTVGTFVGAAAGSSGDGATWKADIRHTVETIPSGSITGGYAELLTTDLTKVHGDFSSGTLTLVSTGSGTCGKPDPQGPREARERHSQR